MAMASWQPRATDGAPARVGEVGRWLSSSDDVFATDASARVALWAADRLPVIFPRQWPAVYKESAALTKLLNKSMLKGTRCRAVALPSETEFQSLGGLLLHPLHGFSNALQVAATLGWPVIKGFVVLERSEASPGESFIALRHWWNSKGEGGAWIDFTPPMWPVNDGHILLVESPLGEKEETALTQGGLNFAVGLARRLAAGASPQSPQDMPAIPSREAAPTEAATRQCHTASSQKPKIDYSKWDHLDVSDEDEPEPRKV